MYLPAPYTSNENGGAYVSHSVWRVSRLRPVGGAAVVQGANIKLRTFKLISLEMPLIVIDLTFLEGRNNEIVVKELAVADSHSKSVSSYVFNPLNAELKPIFDLLALLGVHHTLHISRLRVETIWMGRTTYVYR
jgi:hypothetical protein